MRTSIMAAGLILAGVGVAGCVAPRQPWVAQPALTQPAAPAAAKGPPTLEEVDKAIEAIDKITADDRDRIARDFAPKEDLEIDREMRQLLIEARPIVISRDKDKAGDWRAKYNALAARRNQAEKRFTYDWFRRHPGMASQDTGSPFAGRTDPGCIGGHCQWTPPPPEPRTCTVNGIGWVGQAPC
ncbi:hypothetical protein GQ57_20170 [Burkholderia sp. MSh2]|uniref:Lipoprotein n=1 Tax=Burkholderia paludis TaxID=1506587 RepID=A0A6J5E0A9_9BURK|nr:MULTISPECIES: hypothetical protein [Burkholderia]KEZ04246.1 hypothetical protein GQ57_20170 [Burkholderia sp. MSh2]CAB3759144.1 hypothetical protein LMG30113_03379 [Burkholderia paludis]VWB53389.1 hypothetical protein BPA30113_02321 [Burkholderia paludis]